MLKLHELQEARAAAVTNMRALAELADTEKRDLTTEEDSKFSQFKASITDLDKKIERAKFLADAERSAPAIVHGRLGDGTYEERAREFSLQTAVVSQLPRNMGGGNVDTGFNNEISAELARRSGRTFQGIGVPDQALWQEKRTLLAGSSAADLIPNVHRSDLFIDRLRSQLATERLGATVLDGLIGTVDIPRQTGSSAAQWVAEDGSLTETDASFDDVTLSPKTVGAMTSYSRRTLLSASPSIESIIRADLAAITASAIDRVAMLGTGAGNTPVGVVNMPGIHEISTAAGVDWDAILSFIAAVEASDAGAGSMGWALNAWAVKKLRATTKVTADGSAGFLMDQPGQLAGYATATTSALPGIGGASPTLGTMIYGDWSSLLIGYWSGIDLLVNPYETTAYAKGRVLVRAMRDVDVQVRHPESFAFSANLPLTSGGE